MKKLRALLLTLARLATSLLSIWAEEASSGDSAGASAGIAAGEVDNEEASSGEFSGDAAGMAGTEDASSGESAGETAAPCERRGRRGNYRHYE